MSWSVIVARSYDEVKASNDDEPDDDSVMVETEGLLAGTNNETKGRYVYCGSPCRATQSESDALASRIIPVFY